MTDSSIDRFAIIVGSMKSGTTTLFQYLAAHPQIAACSIKEPNFFTKNPGADANYTAYRSLWEWDPTRHMVALEASTSYTMARGESRVPERMRSYQDLSFQFIYIMRDPVERLASHLSHLATRRGGADRVDEADFRHALHVSRYATQLDAYAAQWPRERILPLVYERLTNDPAAVLDRVQSFLSLARQPLNSLVTKQVHNSRTDLAADQILAGISARAPWLEVMRRWVPNRAVEAVRCAVGAWGSREVTLSRDQREGAVEALRPELARLRREWGIDTSDWVSVQ